MVPLQSETTFSRSIVCKYLHRQMDVAVYATVDWCSLLLSWPVKNAVSYVIVSPVSAPDSPLHPTFAAECDPQRPAATAAVLDGFLSLVLVTMVAQVKMMSITVFHPILSNFLDHWVWVKKNQSYLKLVIFFAFPRIICTVFLNPTENSGLTPTLWRLLHSSLRDLRRNAKLHRKHSSNPDQTATVQAYGWLMKMFRMFGIASHLVRSFVPRRNIFDSEIQQRKETFLQNKRRFTSGHKACVICVTRPELLLYVIFELILEFIEGKIEWNKSLKYDNCVSVHSCRTPFSVTLLKTPKTWTRAGATVVPRISPHFISKIRLWPLTPNTQLLHPAECPKGDF